MSGGRGVQPPFHSVAFHPGGRAGFTLIEVIAALVIFAVAVMLAAGLTGALAVQMRDSALRSQVVVRAQQRLDSISLRPYDSVPVGARTDTVQLQGKAYLSTLDVIQVAPRVRKVQVSLAPALPPGRQYNIVGYLVAPW
jgi:prepilin-type N-terminal cleavage/methylation domain-containing protein